MHLIFRILWARHQPQVFLANVPCLAIIQNHSHATIWMIQGMVEHFARNEIAYLPVVVSRTNEMLRHQTFHDHLGPRFPGRTWRNCGLQKKGMRSGGGVGGGGR